MGASPIRGSYPFRERRRLSPMPPAAWSGRGVDCLPSQKGARRGRKNGGRDMRTQRMTGLLAAMGMGVALAACGTAPEHASLPDWPAPSAAGTFDGAGDAQDGRVHFQLIRAESAPAGHIEQVIGDEHVQQVLDGNG